jgi:hypothetical protein
MYTDIQNWNKLLSDDQTKIEEIVSKLKDEGNEAPNLTARELVTLRNWLRLATSKIEYRIDVLLTNLNS